jgi:dTDP-4-amino-4,6-dideoxygalactose transaminase
MLRPSSRKIYYSGTKLGLKEAISVFQPIDTHASLSMFSQKLSEHMGGGYSFPLYRARTATYAALKAWGVGVGDEVLLQSFIVPSVVDAVLSTGARPAFVDIEEKYWTTDVESIKEHITPKTKAIIPVHTYGQPCDMGAIMDIAKDHDLRVIEDCAHAPGGKFHGKALGSFGDAAVFSSNLDKAISAGTGGALYTNDKELAEKISKVVGGFPECTPGERLYAVRKLAASMLFSSPPLYGAWQTIFPNKNDPSADILYGGDETMASIYKPVILKPMTREVALFVTQQISQIGRMVEARNQNAKKLGERLKRREVLELPPIRKDCFHSFLIYTVKVGGINPTETRDRLNKAFWRRGIYAGNLLWTYAIHTHPQYGGLLKRQEMEDFPVTDDLLASLINIPVHPLLNDNDIDNIVETVGEVV